MAGFVQFARHKAVAIKYMSNLEQQAKKAIRWAEHLFVSDSYEKPGVRPLSDWKIILPTFFCSLLILGCFAFYFYLNVQDGALWSASSGDELLPVYQINQKNLTAVTDIFGQKEKNLHDLENGVKAIPPDPSL